MKRNARRQALLEALTRFLEAAEDVAKQRLEQQLQLMAASTFADEGAAFAQAVAAGRDVEAATEIALTAGREALQKAIQAATEQAITQAMQEQATALGIAFDLKNPRAVAYAQQHAAEMVTRIDDETRSQIKALVIQGTDEGWSYDKIAKEITARFAQFAEPKPQQHIDSRAHLVAVTEIGNAYEEGNAIVARDLAKVLPMEKYWQTVGDSRVSAGCQENQAAGWIPLDQAFPSGDERPLRFPGCRCTALYRRVQDQ